MINGIEIAFWGVLTFSLLVLVHEGGHFLAARAFGVKVHEFMIGLPGPRLTFRGRSGTTYGITAVPLGGYVRIAGMEPGAEDPLLAQALSFATSLERVTATDLSSELGVDPERAAALLYTLADWDALFVIPGEGDPAYAKAPDLPAGESPDRTLDAARASTYRGLSTFKRIVVLGMGVLTNLLCAILVFTTVLSIWGYYRQSLTVAEVQSVSAAHDAGIRAGDTLVALDEEPIADWFALTRELGSRDVGDPVVLTVLRDRSELTLPATLGEGPEGQPFLGLVAGTEKVDLTVFQALKESFLWTGMVFVAIASFFNPDTFATSIQGARSIVGISVEVAEAARTGPIDYAWWVALLSLSLGAMNLLPIPPLDGGKIAMEIIERIAGRPIERRISLGVSVAGALLLFSFIGYVMYADVMRYFVNG